MKDIRSIFIRYQVNKLYTINWCQCKKHFGDGQTKRIVSSMKCAFNSSVSLKKNVHWITIQYFLLQTALETDCLHVECHRGVSINTVRHCVCGHAKKCLNLWLLLFNTSQKNTKSLFWKNAQYMCHALLIWWPFLVIHITDAKTHVLHRFHEKKKHNKLGVPI